MSLLQPVRQAFSKPSWTGAALAAIFLVGALFRAWAPGEQSLWIDEGFTINAAQGVIEHGYPLLDSGRVYDKHLLSSYLAAASMEVFGFDAFSPWSARLPSIVLGSLLVLAGYGFSRRLSLSKVSSSCLALATALLACEIAWSRQARGYAGLSLFLVLSFSLLAAALVRRKRSQAIAAGICFVIAWLSHGLGIVFLPAFASLALSVYLIASGKLPAGRRLWYVPAAASLCGAVAIALFMGWGYGFTAAYISLSKADPLLFPLFSAALIGAIMSLFDTKRRDLMPFAVVPFISSFVAISCLGGSLGTRYLIPIVPFALILAAYASVRACELMPFRRGRAYLSVAIFALIVCRGVSLVPHADYSLGIGSPQPDFKSAFAYLKEHMGPDDVVISPYSHLHKIYLGTPGLHLAMNLRNKKFEDQTETENSFNAVAPLINGLPAFKDAVSRGHGYVLFDTMAFIRLEDYMYALTGMKGVSKAYEQGTDILDDMIRIYRF